MIVRLAGLFVDNERMIDGYAVSRNMPPLGELPIRRFCNFLYWWATRNAEKESDVKKFEAQLYRPPPGRAPSKDSPWAPENEAAAFASLKAGLGK